MRAVVIYGGEKVFAAGADIKEMVTADYASMVERAAPLQAAFDALARIPKPTVAAITGYALGGGCELALTADFRVCGDNAKLGQPEILLGIIPGAGGTQRLPRLIGPARAKDLVYSGRFVGAAEALAIGLVDKVVGARRRALGGGRAGLAVTPPGRRWRCARRRRPSTAAWTATSPAGLRLETPAVRRPVRDRGPGHRDGVVRRERPRQGAVRGALMAVSREEVDAARADPKRGERSLPRLGSRLVRREVVDLVRRALRRPTPGTGSRTSRTGRPRRTRGRWRSAAGTGFFLLNLMQAGRRRPRLGDRHQPRHGGGGARATPGPSASTSTGGWPTPRRSRTRTRRSTWWSGHAVLHHIPDVERALREVLRVLKPGGRFVFAGEPTRYGDVIARRLSRATWWTATRVTRLPALRGLAPAAARAGRVVAGGGAGGGRRPAHVRPGDAAPAGHRGRRGGRVGAHRGADRGLVRLAGADVRGGGAGRASSGWDWAMFAYRTWQRLSAVDRRLARVVPAGLFYNALVTGIRPGVPAHRDT